MFCTFPAWALFLTLVESNVARELPRFFTLGFGVTEGENLRRVVDDDMLLELLVLVNVLLEETFNAGIVTDSFDGAIAVVAIILRG